MSTPQQCLTASQWRGRGGKAASSTLPSLAGDQQSRPRPALWQSLCQQCRSSSLSPVVVWVPMHTFLPGGALHILPHGRTGGRMGWMLPQQSLHLTPALPPLGGGESWAPLCAYSSIFPAAVRLASMYKLYLSLSVCRGQMLSKRAVVCRLYPSWVIIQNRFSNCAVFHLQVRNSVSCMSGVSGYEPTFQPPEGARGPQLLHSTRGALLPQEQRETPHPNWQGSKLFPDPAVPCSLPLSLAKSLKGFHLGPHIPQ